MISFIVYFKEQTLTSLYLYGFCFLCHKNEENSPYLEVVVYHLMFSIQSFAFPVQVLNLEWVSVAVGGSGPQFFLTSALGLLSLCSFRSTFKLNFQITLSSSMKIQMGLWLELHSFY